jgi:hypothetical protein
MSTETLEMRPAPRKAREKSKPKKPERKRCCPAQIVGRFLIFVHYDGENKASILRWSKPALRESACVECFLERALRGNLIAPYLQEKYGNNVFLCLSDDAFELIGELLYDATLSNRLRANLHTWGGMA